MLMLYAGLIYTDEFCYKNMKKIRENIDSGRKYVEPPSYFSCQFSEDLIKYIFGVI